VNPVLADSGIVRNEQRVAFFASAAKTPFSTLVIVCELTGDFGLIAPALGVCVGCFLLSGQDSLFDSQPAHRTDAPVQDSSQMPLELTAPGQ